MKPRIQTRDMLSTQYSLQNVSVEWLRPHAATKLALTEARMARLRADLRDLTARLRSASAEGKAA
jgi:hypothetical protein